MKAVKTILKLSAVVGVIGALTGCVFAPVCNQQGGYAQGVMDGQYRLPENFNYAATCPNNAWRIDKAYRRGYHHGLRMPQPIDPAIVVNSAPLYPWHPHHSHWHPQPNPWHPHGHHHNHPHPNPGPRPHPHHHHRIIPGVPTPIHVATTTSVSKTASVSLVGHS